MKKIIIITLIILTLAAGAVGGYFYCQLSPVGAGVDKILFIEKGQNLSGIADMLQQEHLIRSAWYFKLLAKMRGSENKIKFGEYKISPKESSVQILDKLVQGKVYMHLVTIPEGFTLKQVSVRLARENIVKEEEFLHLASNNTTIDINGYIPPTLEGYLFPDSYYFCRGLAASDVINILVEKFKEKVIPVYEEAKKQNPKLMNLPDIVTLASIVEAEAKLDRERPIIASVYYNRLREKILLQCDATVQYIMEERKINLKYSDLTIDSPYNTYLYPGLPPTPICNPGILSIKACLYPAQTQYIYFVRNDKAGDGSHIFTRTFQEHEQAIEKYQLY